MAKAIKTIGVLTSGGDAPGMNAAIRAVVRVAINKGLKVKGIMRGYAGLLDEEIVDMDSTSVFRYYQPGRHHSLYRPLHGIYRPLRARRRALRSAVNTAIDGMVVIGGDGSFRGAGKLSALGINTIGLPGNPSTWILPVPITPSDFDTAVNTAMEAIDKNP